MKKAFYYFWTVLALMACVSIMFMPHATHTKSLFQENGAPTEQLKQVFTHLGVPIETLEQANTYAQKNLLRTGERWDAQADTPVIQTIRAQEKLLKKDLEALGMMKETLPTKKEYDYALLLGALRVRFEQRLAYLAELEAQGYTFNSIVLLGGERSLRAEEREGLPETVTTEAHMMAYLFEQSRGLTDAILVNAPMIQKEDGTFTRPTTDSTLAFFAKTAPHDGSCVVISNQPYAGRQTLVAQRVLDQLRFPTEGAGKEVKEDTGDTVMFMDEFARTVYEVYLQSKS